MNADIDISDIVLKTDQLILRPFKMSDLDDFYNYASVKGVGEMAGWNHHKNKDESKEILELFIKEKNTFALVLNDKVIGSIGVDKYDEEDLIKYKDLKGREIGCVLAKEYWGQGIMVEAISKIIDYLFNDLHLDFLIYCYFSYNLQSKRVSEKLGFKYLKTNNNFKTRNGLIVDDCLTILNNPSSNPLSL